MHTIERIQILHVLVVVEKGSRILFVSVVQQGRSFQIRWHVFALEAYSSGREAAHNGNHNSNDRRSAV